MLLKLHDEYTYRVLKKFDNLDKKKAKEILKGSFVNDLCELTNKYTVINNLLNKYIKIKKEKGALDYSPFYQSHCGKLSALHCMANIENEHPEVTQIKILNWLNFLEFIMFNINKNILKNKINEFEYILGDQVNELKFKLSDLFDTNDVFNAKYRALGMIIHIIEDSYTISHCKRDGLYIKEFYCYKLQSSSLHKENDYVLNEYEEYLLKNIHNVLKTLLAENSAELYYKEIFKLADNPSYSSNGGFE